MKDFFKSIAKEWEDFKERMKDSIDKILYPDGCVEKKKDENK